MKIRTKVLITGLVSLAIAVAITFIVSKLLLSDYVSQEEKNYVKQYISGSNEIINKEEELLESIQQDWAQFDDTYQFISNRNSDFISSNLEEESLEMLNLNFIIILDKDFNLVCLSSHNIDKKISDLLLERFNDNRKSDSYLGQLDKGPITGIANISDLPMFISISPVTTSDGQAPPNGYLAMGRYLNQKFINYMEDILKVNIEINKALANNIGVMKYIENLNGCETEIFKDKHSLMSIISIDDFFKKQPTTVSYTIDRKLYKNGITAIVYFVVIYFSAMLVVAAICIYVFNKFVTNRIGKLHEFIEGVSKSRDASSRISVKWNDEISWLSSNVNQMLGELDNSYKNLKKTEERFRLIMEATNDGFFDENLKTGEIHFSKAWLDYLGNKMEGEYVSYAQI